jgi:hypothetical protein
MPEDSEIMLHNLNLTDMPKGDYLTKLVHRRAMYEAQDIDDNYYCFVCGKTFNHPDDFTSHYQEHLDDFMAGIPIERTDEHIEKMVQNIHPHHRKEAIEILKNTGTVTKINR